MPNKLTFEEVKSNIDNIEGYKLLSKEYINNRTKLDILHEECGRTFPMTYDGFHGRKNRCPHCANEHRNDNNKYTFKEVKSYIENDGHYILMTEEYKNYRQELLVFHKDCNKKFKTNFDRFKNQGYRCPHCYGTKKYTLEEVKELVKNYKNGEYELLSTVYNNNKEKLDIKHLKCGITRSISLNNFLSDKANCPYCSNKDSKGIIKIKEYLTKNKIPFKIEHRYDDCRDQRTLPFDFYIEEFNLCIEFDGDQHLRPDHFTNDKEYNLRKFKTTQKHDRMKSLYCFENDINFLRIADSEYNQIDEILDDTFFQLTH